MVPVGRDQHYTPAEIAQALVRQIRWGRRRPVTVADFAAGHGALLTAVEKEFKQPTLVATDIDPLAVAELRASHPSWVVGRCDFLNPRSVAQSVIAGARPDVAVLNPPFSSRGGSTVRSHVLGVVLSSSLSMAFLLRAVERVAAGGEVSALLPLSVFSTEKDERAWNLLSARCAITRGPTFGRSGFRGAFAATGVVHVKVGCPRPTASGESAGVTTPRDRTASAVLHRGRLPVYRTSTDGIPILHTTTIRANEAHVHATLRAPESYALQGPLLVIPRVGLPKRSKVALFDSDATVALSDCLFGLAASRDQLLLIRHLVHERWEEFADCYDGSCAPYTTVRRITAALEALGVHIELEVRLCRHVRPV